MRWLGRHSFGLVKITAKLHVHVVHPSYGLLEGHAGKLNFLCTVIGFKWSSLSLSDG